MVDERLRRRLRHDPPATTITLRLPADVVDALKAIASARGFGCYQTVLKHYIGAGLRREEMWSGPHVIHNLREVLMLQGLK